MSHDTGEELSVRVVQALADARGIEPADLDVRLGEWIDVDALERLAGHDGGEWTVTFTVAEWTVTVDHEGEVTVTTK